MPIQGIVNTARALSYYTRLQEVTANNLANVNSDGFKADRVSGHQLPGGSFPVPVEKVDLEQGTFKETGRTLDLAIDGPGFLVVRTAQGDRLTRGGSLSIDSAGQLTDSHGNPVIGEQGPLVIQGGSLEVKSDGQLLVDGAAAGRLQLVEPEDASQLSKEGGGRFVVNGALHPATAATRLRQGAVEEPNLDPMLSMVDLVSIQRAYAANIDALKAMDGVLSVITGEVGRP
jgi:flagellar basal body rod protein FlgG